MTARNRASRRDAAEKPIVDALRACGFKVDRVSGPGLPDLLVSHGRPPHQRVWAFEVKTGKAKRTEAQDVSQWPIVRSVDDALKAIIWVTR